MRMSLAPPLVVAVSLTIALLASGGCYPLLAKSALGQPSPNQPTLITPAQTASSSLLAGLARHDRREETVVTVTWLPPWYLRMYPFDRLGVNTQASLVFEIIVESPNLTMSVWDLKGMIYMREQGGKEYGTPTWIPTEYLPRRAGIAVFPNKDARGHPVPASGSHYFEVVLRDLEGVKERVFHWDLGFD